MSKSDEVRLIGEKPKGPCLGPQDALAWVSFKLIEVMVQREAVELASLILRSAGIGEGRTPDGGRNEESLYSLTWKAVKQANGVYGEALAEWFGLFLATREVETQPQEPRPSIHEVLDEIRAQAMVALDTRLRKHVEYETTSGVSWLGEARQRMVEVLTQVVRHGKDPRDLMHNLGDAPYDPVTSADRILRTLGCHEDVSRDAVHRALRSAGLAPDAVNVDRAVSDLWSDGPDGPQEAAYRVLRAFGYSDKVARDALDRVLREKAGMAPNAVAVDLDRALREFRDANPPKDAQEAAYRVLRILGYDDKIAEGALAKSLGFVPTAAESEL